MYQHVAAHFITGRDWCEYGQLVIAERLVKTVDGVIFTAKVADIKALDFQILMQSLGIGRVNNDTAGYVNDFDLRIQIMADRLQVAVQISQFQAAVIVAQSIAGGDFGAFRVQRMCFAGFHLIPQAVMCDCGYKDKTEDAKDEVTG